MPGGVVMSIGAIAGESDNISEDKNVDANVCDNEV